MIADTKSAAETRAREWAAEQLGVPPESSAEDCTAAFLRRLAEEDFVPPPRLRQAWELASHGSLARRPAMPWLESEAEEELSDQIEEFAGQFFGFPPDERQSHWEHLYADAVRWPRLQARMLGLKPGLAIEFAPLPALSVREAKLIQWIRELFPLPLAQRALRRREMLRHEVGSDNRPWQKAARRVRRRQRAIAALAPDLLLPLATWSRKVSRALQNRQRRKATLVRSRPTILSLLRTSKAIRRAPIIAVVVCVLTAILSDTKRQQRWSAPPAPIQRPQTIDPIEVNKGLQEAYEILKKNGQIPNPAAVPPARSPSDDSPSDHTPPFQFSPNGVPPLNPAPGNPRPANPRKSIKDILFPNGDSHPLPESGPAAGQTR